MVGLTQKEYKILSNFILPSSQRDSDYCRQDIDRKYPAAVKSLRKKRYIRYGPWQSWYVTKEGIEAIKQRI